MSHEQHLKNAAEATPAAAAATATLVLGMRPDEWLSFAGIVFIALQAVYLLWKWRRDARKDREEREAREDAA